jgi:hypothetical protein
MHSSDQPRVLTKQRLSDDAIILFLTTGFGVLIAAVWSIMGRPLMG